MTYQRVIPRDLFNEANLLKCLGQLYLELEKLNLPEILLEHDGEAFDIRQDQDDGATYVTNVYLTMPESEAHSFHRPMNSRYPWPLYVDIGSEEVAVFNDDGTLSAEFLAFLS